MHTRDQAHAGIIERVAAEELVEEVVGGPGIVVGLVDRRILGRTIPLAAGEPAWKIVAAAGVVDQPISAQPGDGVARNVGIDRTRSRTAYTAVAWARSTTARRRATASPDSAIRSSRKGGMMQASGCRPQDGPESRMSGFSSLH
jgi:hypothetical protein